MWVYGLRYNSTLRICPWLKIRQTCACSHPLLEPEHMIWEAPLQVLVGRHERLSFRVDECAVLLQLGRSQRTVGGQLLPGPRLVKSHFVLVSGDFSL